MKLNNWNILCLPPFKTRLSKLISEVQDLSIKDPTGYETHPDTKLLANIFDTIKDISENPFHAKFQLGKALGEKYKHWRRAKNLLPKRYRLFFRAHTPEKTIVLGWINDDTTLRKKGDKNDVYTVFRQMLDNESIPNDIDQLIEQAEKPPNPSNK